MAHRFDPVRMELAGEPIPFLDRTDGGENFSCSANGTLCYRQFRRTTYRVNKFDRSGNKADSIGPPGAYVSLQLSRDGTRAALEKVRAGAEADLWTIDLNRGIKTRITRPLLTVWNYARIGIPTAAGLRSPPIETSSRKNLISLMEIFTSSP